MQDGSWIRKNICVQFEVRKKFYSALEWPFELGFTEKIPKNIGGQFGELSGFLKTFFEIERPKKKKKHRNTGGLKNVFLETSSSLFLGRSAVRPAYLYVLNINCLKRFYEALHWCLTM